MSMAIAMQRFGRYGDILLASLVLGVLLIMIVPVPPMIMDLMLATNITLGILILLTSIYILKPMNFSVFPSLLLLSTLFRLSLNVATTRMILLHGSEGPSAAGHVIQGFGHFVVGGNTVVGLIIFLILVLINFIVITKGSTRIAEVAARFTLDAMPGKQMAIDADLNAGLIDDATARRRRESTSREADFYGSMDGASKFVRGDAVAGLIITAINIFGGFIIGTMQQGMPMSEAMETYSLLTVGDGLVAQIPALLISTAAGIIITRAGGENTLTAELSAQFTQNPRVYMVGCGALALMSLIPGLPFIPFILIATGLGVTAWSLAGAEEIEPAAPAPTGIKKEASEKQLMSELLAVDPICLEVGYGLIDLVESAADGNLLDRIQMVRKQVAGEVGFILPPVHIKDNLQLGVGEYHLQVRGAEVARGDIRPRQLMALDGQNNGPGLEGEETQEPAFGLPALWIDQDKRQQAELSGYTVVDPTTVIVTHITEILRRFSFEMLDRVQVQSLLDSLSERHPKVVEDIIPGSVSIGTLQNVLQRLLAEWVPIRDLILILETLADHPDHVREIPYLVERVRERLGRSIVQPLLDQQGELQVFTFDPVVENEMTERIRNYPESSLPMEINAWQRLLSAISRAISQENIDMPIILTMPILRASLARTLSANMVRITVLSVAEIPPNIPVRTLQTIGVNHAG